MVENKPYKVVKILGMSLHEWEYKGCIAHFGIGEDWATLYDIESKNKGKGYATKLLKEARKYHILPIKDTKPEIKMQQLLKELNIDFVTHKYMNIEHGYQCDILIPSMNLIIECDGDYWHNILQVKKRDKKQDLIFKNNGYDVYRFWEHEINKSPINCLKRVAKLWK